MQISTQIDAKTAKTILKYECMKEPTNKKQQKWKTCQENIYTNKTYAFGLNVQ